MQIKVNDNEFQLLWEKKDSGAQQRKTDDLCRSRTVKMLICTEVTSR